MCWMCDKPDSEIVDYLKHLNGVIREHGWAVQGVERHGDQPAWAYTIGLTERGQPELLVTGLPLSQARILLNNVASHMINPAGHGPSPGDRTQLANGRQLEIVAVSEPLEHLRFAVELYGDSVQACQLVYSDLEGRWPWDRDHRGAPGGQPMLGTRVARDDVDSVP